MNKHIPFVEVLGPRPQGQRPTQDLASFEYSYHAEITNVYPLTATEKLYQIQLCDPGLRRTFSFSPG